MSQMQSLGVSGLAYKSTNDLSALTNIYLAVIPDTGNKGQVVLAGANAPVLGWLQNNPKAGEVATIIGLRGASSKMIAGAATSVGDKLETDSSARVVTSSVSGHFVVGLGMEAATAAGDIIEGVIIDSKVT